MSDQKRPQTPGFVSSWANLDRRLRDVERNVLFPPDDDDDLLQGYENGNPLGPLEHLDFGTGIKASLIGDRYAKVTVTLPNAEGFDALVDNTLSESDPDNRLFVGIGEASTWLAGEGFTYASIAVRLTGTDYVETSNWTPLNHTFLFGIRGTGQGAGTSDVYIGALEATVRWRWNDFAPTLGEKNMDMRGIRLEAGESTGNSQPFNTLRAIDCYFETAEQPTSASFSMCNFFVGLRCQFDFVNTAGTRQWAELEAYFEFCDMEIRGTSGADVTWNLAGGHLSMRGGKLGVSSGTHTINLPASFDIDVFDARFVTTGTTTLVHTMIVPAGGRGSIKVRPTGDNTRSWVVDASANFEELYIEGRFQSITATGTHTALTVLASTQNGLDVSGPATIHHTALKDSSLNPTTTIRGSGVAGTIGGRYTTGSSFTALQFVGADHCAIIASLFGTGTSGTSAPYSFDASSDHNLLMLAGATTWPNAGSDSGSNNRVETTPGTGAPNNVDYLVGTASSALSSEIVVGTTPGGELGGTWASPTVDATHSGSAHSDFIAKAFLDAKGDLISASADDTPIILTVGTDSFILQADSSEPSGLKWVPVSDILNPTAGWGSITNVSTDRVYDASSTSVNELANVLGTLVADLIAQGVLSA